MVYEELVRGNVEAMPLAKMKGKIPAVMLVPYPPGIPVIMPGERFSGEAEAILEYLAAYEDFDNSFPGFETETHGVDPRKEGERITYYVNCIKEYGLHHASNVYCEEKCPTPVSDTFFDG